MLEKDPEVPQEVPQEEVLQGVLLEGPSPDLPLSRVSIRRRAGGERERTEETAVLLRRVVSNFSLSLSLSLVKVSISLCSLLSKSNNLTSPRSQ